jgi:hypothetical protein
MQKVITVRRYVAKYDKAAVPLPSVGRTVHCKKLGKRVCVCVFFLYVGVFYVTAAIILRVKSLYSMYLV